MEDMMFGLFLFVIFYGFLYWLILEPSEEASTAEDTAWNMNQDGDIVLRNEKGQVTTITPIERQLHDVLWESDKVTTAVTKRLESPIAPTNLKDIEVDTITLRTARKIAKALNIRQKVGGKDQPKKWLVAQIKKALEDNPKKVAPIIVSFQHAA